MATQAQINKFISEIAPCAQKAYKVLGKVKPSVCIGMACVESAYGTAGSARYNSYLGYKVGSGRTATKYWCGKFFNSKTKEEYSIGVHTVITDAFRAYDSMEQCVFNYYELLNTSLYKRVLADSDYRTQMQQIKACGYMTSSTEVNSVIKIIEKYNLTQYDNGSVIAPAEKSKKIDVKIIYKVGATYTTTANLFVRVEPKGEKKLLSELSVNAKAHAYNDGSGHGMLKKGTRVTCKDIREVGNQIWFRTPSGWICANDNGQVYIV